VADGNSNLRPTRRGSQVEKGLEVSRLRLKEYFDRFNFAFYKEKEMADFRKWVLALAVMALFASLASAQGNGVGNPGNGSNNNPFTCSLQNTVTPQLRSEGFAEQTGDIVISCQGGVPLPPGSQIPTIDITVFYNATVTSRLLSTTTNASEALLLIDEPDNGLNTSLTGYGPSLPQMVCGSSNATQGAGPNGCTEYVGTVGGVSGVPVNGSGSTSPGANVFQGIVTSQQVQFFGIPVLPPVTPGVTRVFRITNVRVNANGVGPSAGGPGIVSASISTNGATSLGLTNPNPIVGYISTSLSVSVKNAAGFPQCNATTAYAATLQYSEQFPTAFRTRIDGIQGGATFNYTATVTQNVPGRAYNSESNFVLNGAGQTGQGAASLNTAGLVNTLTGGGFTAGLADYGTRVKAIFHNVPANVNLWVPMTNSPSTSSTSFIPTSNSYTSSSSPFGNSTSTSYAVLLSGEATSDGTGTLPIQTATNSFTAPSGSTFGNYYVVTSQGTDIVATWEVINTQPTVQENLYFPVLISYSSPTTTFPPAPTTGTVTMTYAPTPTNNAFSASSGGSTAVNTLIPRFVDSSGGAVSTFFTINLCQTVLLFPYVTTAPGFDTGIEIANTTTDYTPTFTGATKTVTQQGTCTLNWYQGGTAGNPPATITPLIPTGTIYINNASATGMAGQGFAGYMFAVCNFQLAHGAGVITDLGVQHILSVYLALVVASPLNRNLTAGGTPENLNN